MLKISLRPIACLPLLFTTLAVTPVLADQSGITREVGAASRVEAADRLRTLSQEVASSACHLVHEVSPEKSEAMLRESIDEFDMLLNALRDGDIEKGILEPETNRRTLRELDAVRVEWREVREMAMAAIAGHDNKVAIETLYADTEHVLETTEVLFAQISGEYANPIELLQSDAILLDIVGQQAMHAQRIAFEGCKVWSNEATEEQVADLAKTVGQFEMALYALHDGMPAVGVPPAPTPEIAKILEDATVNWADIRVITDKLVTGQSITAQEQVELFIAMDDKMHVMEELAHLYALYSRRALH